jgi:POT family proton-dependent oligopeptide transporter
MNATTTTVPTLPEPARMPRQIPFIIGNEGCERFSFYGMRNVLTTFLISFLLLDVAEADRAAAAKDVMHTFIIGVYFFPLLGGWLADRFLGKYNTIFLLSLVYCAGHACLAVFEGYRPGFYLGLGLIAFGSGGIKPCVSSFVGDQFNQSNKHLAKIVFDAFYWIINFGSFFASLLIPFFLTAFGPKVAFGVPGALMFVATVVLWLGRKQYVMVPARPADPDAFSAVLKTALLSNVGGPRLGLGVAALGVLLAFGALSAMSSLGFVPAFCLALVCLLALGGGGAWMQLERARGHHPDADIEGARSVLRVLVLFALVTPFWSLFDQKTSTWVIQAGAMTKPEWFQPSQMQALNPLLVMAFIPLNNLVLYPGLRRLGLEVTALRRMTAGIVFAVVSWIVVGLLQLRLDGGNTLSIVWQVLPYAILTFGEVLVSATGLEFAYSQAPPKMKGVLMSFWSLSVTVGNLWVLLANGAVKNDHVTSSITSAGFGVVAFQMFFFAGFAFVAALCFGLVARRYPVVDHYRS